MDDGDYTFLNVPGQIDVRGFMADKFVRRLYYTEKGKSEVLLFDSEDCQTTVDGDTVTLELKSDENKPILLTITTHCAKPNDNSRSKWHLNSTLVTADDCHESGESDDGDDDDDDNDAMSVSEIEKQQEKLDSNINSLEMKLKSISEKINKTRQNEYTYANER